MDRNEDGRFGRRCGSTSHEGDKRSLHLTDLRKRKGISAKNYELLLQQGVILKSTHYICRVCLENSIPKETEDESRISDDKNLEDDDIKFYEKIIDVATKIEREISDDAKDLRQQRLKSFEDIISFDPAKWLCDRPDNLLHFITSLCNVDVNTTTPCQIVLISKIVELIYAFMQPLFRKSALLQLYELQILFELFGKEIPRRGLFFHMQLAPGAKQRTAEISQWPSESHF